MNENGNAEAQTFIGSGVGIKMSLRRALRLKNTLKGDIAELSNTIRRHNIYDEKTPQENMVDVKFAAEMLNYKKVFLCGLKEAIAKANVAIYADLVAIEEIKADIAFWNAVPVDIKPSIAYTDKDGKPMYERKYTHISAPEVADILIQAKKALENALERVDEYNAKTMIDIPNPEMPKKENVELKKP